MKDIIKEAQEISVLAHELFRYDLRNENLSESDLITQSSEKSQDWLNKPLSLLFNQSPMEVILSGRSHDLKNFLKDKLGISHE